MTINIKKDGNWVKIPVMGNVAGIPEAPIDDKFYARRNGEWGELVLEGTGADLTEVNAKIQDNARAIAENTHAIANLPTRDEVNTSINNAVTSVYRVKGSVENSSSLPTTGVLVGDVYNILSTGENVVAIAVNGTKVTWDKLSETVDLTGYMTYTGGDLLGPLNFANNTWNKVGDDLFIGDKNVAGKLALKSAQSGVAPGFVFYNSNGDNIGMLQNTSGKSLYYHDTVNWYKIWHEGNDGEGSGLDADTLDGHEYGEIISNGVFIMYHRKVDNYPLAVTPDKWSSLQNSGEIADGVLIIEGDKHLVVAPTDDLRYWSSANVSGGGKSTANRSIALNDFEGHSNTISQITHTECSGVEYAPGYCSQYSTANVNGHGLGAGKWWLPSLGELMMICANMSKINYALSLINGATQLSDTWYWSSTENSAIYAWGLYFGDSSANNHFKATYQFRVRAVSAFYRYDDNPTPRMPWSNILESPKLNEFTNALTNVGSAKKLETPVKIWGQSFDGSKSIENNLTIYRCIEGNSGWARAIDCKNHRDEVTMEIGFHGKEDYLLKTYIGPNYYTPYFSIQGEGDSIVHKRLKIGENSSPEYSLDVAGNAKIKSFEVEQLKLVRATSAGSFMSFCPKNQETNRWAIGAGLEENPWIFTFIFKNASGETNVAHFTSEGNFYVKNMAVAKSFLGDGSQLTNLNATNITTGTLSASVMPATKTINGQSIFGSGNIDISGGSGTGSDEVYISEGVEPTGSQEVWIDLSDNSVDELVVPEAPINENSYVRKGGNWVDLSTVIPYNEDDHAYGIQFDTTISSPDCTRIGNMNLHRTLPIQSKMKGCLLDDDGNVVEYLNPNDWTSNVLDGSRGQVMVEIPKHYRRCVTDGTMRKVLISEYPLPGYHLIPKCYISAYEASLERSTNKLCSVVNVSEDYRGGNNNTEWDGTYRSLLGMPVTNLDLTNFRNCARNRKPSSAEWNCLTYDIYKNLYWLFTIEYATLNSQAECNSQLTSDGLHQGGLGAGVTTLNDTKWSNFNGYNPFIPCGTTDSLGNHTGVVVFTMPSEYDAATTVVYVPSYRGVENPFGHIWKWTDGCKVMVQSNTDGGLSEFYVCDNPEHFTSSGTANYQLRGNLSRKEGYVKSLIFGEDGEIIPLEIGGSSTTYFCDYFYTYIPESGVSERGVLFCSRALNTVSAGFICSYTNHLPSAKAASFGSRLCFIPNNN